jgi:Protein of unknown function (DUF3617)
MEHTTHRFTAVAWVILTGLPTPVGAASPMEPGLWELRVSTTVSRQSLPVMTTRECIAQKDIDQDKALPRPDANCVLSNIATTGNRTTYALSCKRDEFTNAGRMELVIGSQNYDGMADMTVSAPGKKDTPMTVLVNARRIGDCAK